MSRLQPLVIVPKITPAIWGGDALVRRYGKEADPTEKIGESWECWDTNKVTGGLFDGKTIAELRALLGARLLGKLDPSRSFPVLTKIIDAHQSLSVQVHPDDAYAQRVEHQPNGKTECWVILAAEEGAELVLGWTKDTTREEYERRVADGTLGDILRRVSVKPDDAFYLPSGTLHAIGAGIQLFETQQASDLTYRIFDWNRVGADGKPRELHVQKAGDVLDYHAGKTAATQHLRYEADGVTMTSYISDPRFVVERISVKAGTTGVLRPDGEPVIVMANNAPMELQVEGNLTQLPRWTTALIPAEVERFEVRGAEAGGALSVTPDRDVFLRRLERAGVSASERDAFLAQFETVKAGAA